MFSDDATMALDLLFSLAISFSWIAILLKIENVCLDRFDKQIIRLRQPHWIHFGKSSRLGGLAIVLAFVSWESLDYSSLSIISKILVAGAPIFLAGLVEDFGVPIRPIYRVFATLVSGYLATFFLGGGLETLGLGFDQTLQANTWLAITISSILALGLSQSFNLVDGINGLASGLFLQSLLFSLALFDILEIDKFDVGLIFFASIVTAFWLVNFFTGRVFLGDSGAYLLGFMFAWIAMHGVGTGSVINPWAFLLIVGYPVTEMTITIIRRAVAKSNLGTPDKNHLHNKLLIFVETRTGCSQKVAQQITTLIILSWATLPNIAGFAFYDNVTACKVCFFLLFTCTACVYVRINRLV